MGLDLYVDDEWVFGSSYSTFNEWRDHIYSVSGSIDVEELDTRKRNAYGYWDEIPIDPILILMIHHDDQGYIFPREAKELKERIKGLMHEIDTGWKAHTKQFLKALSMCIKTGERIEFT